MASVLEQQKNPAAKFGSQVDEQIAQATSRIRAHDLTFGTLALAALVAFYATTMILLDKYLNLNEWIRQFTLLGFVGVFAATAYWLIVRPLRNRINPLYAATQVEKTIDDAKNSVTGYVEAQEKGDVHSAVKAAMSAKAAQAVGDADVNKAVDHRSLVVVGGVFVFFLLTLVVLFFVFRPTQFNSLLGRSFVPFSSDTIASQTQLTLNKPDPAEPTITNGQTIFVAVHVGGKVPAKDSPNRVRVLIRHNQADPDYEEIPMKEGETSRDWQVKVPEDLVLNGFWYKVAAGDAETPEYRVTVRSLPLFTGFEATYEYPAYTRKPVDKAFSADIRAIRGTKVTLVARTNREVKEGLMKFEAGGLTPVNGKSVANQPDSLVFQFKVTEQTRYKLFMTTTAGEKNTDPPTFAINPNSDLAPTVQITNPMEVEITVPANGQLAVDGTVGDDYGIDKVRLRLRVEGGGWFELTDQTATALQRANVPETVLMKLTPLKNRALQRGDFVSEIGKVLTNDEKDRYQDLILSQTEGRELAPIPYMGGQSFHRAKDDTWPRDLDYKVSADLTKLKYVDGTAFEPKEAVLIKYWVEAIDNCTEAQPVLDWDKQIGNVGRSNIQQVHLTAPADKQKQDESKDNRKNVEKAHNQNQQQKLNNEKRDNQQQNGDQKGENQAGGDSGNTDPNAAKPQKPGDMNMGEPDNKNPDNKNPDNKNPDNKNPDNKNPDTQPKKANGSPNTQPEGMGPGGMPDPSAAPKPAEPKGPDMPPQPMNGTNNNSTPQKPAEPKGPDMPPQPMNGTNNNGMGMNEKGGMDNNPNPMQQSQDEKKAEEQAKQVQQELDKGKRPESEAKSNPAAKPEDRTDPGQPKPQPKNGPDADAQPKEEPKPNDPMNNPMNGGKNGPGTSKPEGNLEKSTDPAESKPSPTPQDSTAPKQKNAQPSETRDEPLGGSPGQDKSEPKQDGTQPKSTPKNQDPTSGSTGKPSTDKKEDNTGAGSDPGKNEPNNKQKENDPAKNAGKAKPKPDPTRGQDKNPTDPKGGSEDQSSDDAYAGKSKPQTAPESGTAKHGKQDPTNKEQESSEPKPAPSNMNPNDPMNGVAQSKPDQPNSPMGSGGKTPPEKGVEKGMDKSEAKQDGNQKDQLDPKQLEELKEAAKNLGSSDPKKREEARNKLDKSIGEQNRKAFEEYQKKEQEKSEQLQKDLQSPDKATREAAEKKVDEMMQKNPQKGGDGQNPDPKQLEDLKNAAKDLNNPDPKKRDEARNKLDKAIGEQNRKQLEELKDAAKDLGNPDPKKREEAQNKLDNAIGEKNRKALEESQKKEQEKFDQLQKDLQSPDKATREAAEKKAEELMKKAEEEARKENQGGAGNQQEPKLDPKQLEDLKNAAKDLSNPDPKKREEAQNKLDKAVGEQNRKALEEYQKKEKEKFDQLQKDLQSQDKGTREAAEKQVAELMKKAAEQASKEKQGKGKELSQEEVADLANKAKDLNSMDEAKRKEAEKALDDQIGKEAREQLQEEMKNQGDPKQDQELQKKLKEQARRQSSQKIGPADPKDPLLPPPEKPKPPVEDNPKNRAKTAELQLEEFEKNRYNRDLQDRLGWTPEKYEKFLEDQQKRVEQLQKEAAAFDQQTKKPVVPPTGSATINGNSGGKVEGRDNGNKGSTNGTGAVFAPPGFEEAKKKFAEAAKQITPKPDK